MVNILIVGNGRLAKHLLCYFRQLTDVNLSQKLSLSLSHWYREPASSQAITELSLQDLQNKISAADMIFLLISDDAIASFYQQHLAGKNKAVVHCSGALNVPGILSIHPLMSFTNQLYELEIYQKIAWVVFAESSVSNPTLAQAQTQMQIQKQTQAYSYSQAESLTQTENQTRSQNAEGVLQKFLSLLPNPKYYLHPEKKALYHAWCVMGGNFPVLLWSRMQTGFQQLGLDPQISEVYLQQVFQNFVQNPTGALTGPLARKDHQTISKNLLALAQMPEAHIYESFLKVFYPEYFQQRKTE